MTQEEPPVVSISSSTLLSPEDIPKRTFPAARKGVDGEAVRRYLETVATEVSILLDREAQLKHRLAEAERKAAEPPVLDEATLTQAVGAETARVLQSAHDAAREVVAKAEAKAEELVAEARVQADARRRAAEEEASTLLGAAEASVSQAVTTAEAEAAELREAAETEAEAVVEEAREDAVLLLDSTKQRCRQTVREARRLRAEVLSDLLERRRALFVQLEQLRSGRDSLVDVVAAVEATVEDLKERLIGAEHDARIAAAEAGERAELFVDEEAEALLEPDEALEAQSELLGAAAPDEEEAEPVLLVEVEEVEFETEVDELEEQARDTAASHASVGELFARIREARTAEGVVVEEVVLEEVDVEAEEAATVGAADDKTSPASPPVAAADSGAPALNDELAQDEPEAPVGGAAADSGVALTGGSLVHEEAVPAGAGGEGPSAGREPEAAVVADGGGGFEPDAATSEALEETQTDPDEAARARRDELLEPVATKLSRALKRALQDDQNELLNALRKASGKPDLDVLLPEDAQRERIAQAASGALSEGWTLGRGWLRSNGATDASSTAVDTEAADVGRRLGVELAGELSGLLRHRLSESLRALSEVSEGAQDAAGAAYREWKGPRVEGVAGDFATRAFSGGAVAAAHGSLVRWVADDDKPCPDCDDNVLAGVQAAGDVWPTGQTHPPVHPGCRCFLVATSG